MANLDCTNITNSSSLLPLRNSKAKPYFHSNFLILSNSVSEMEAIAICDQVHNNKENIPPFLPANAKPSKNPLPENGSSAKKCKKIIRLKRKPLADITNLYQSRLPLALPSSTLRPSSSVTDSAVLNPRKRKANSNENETGSNSRSLRMGFR